MGLHTHDLITSQGPASSYHHLGAQDSNMRTSLQTQAPPRDPLCILFRVGTGEAQGEVQGGEVGWAEGKVATVLLRGLPPCRSRLSSLSYRMKLKLKY